MAAVSRESMPNSLAVTLLRQMGSATVTAIVLLVSVKYIMGKRRPKSLREYPLAQKKATIVEVKHNVQRQACIAFAKATDHTGNVVLVPDSEFDLDRTIFKAVPGAMARMMMRNKIGNRLYWSDGAVEAIGQAYEAIPKAPSMDKAILDFMVEDCDFSMEHADGSFLDHLNFCHDYSAVHYKVHSPRVLFLHSIMGVGTNCFPMGLDKVPKLKGLLTDFEFKHIEAFPSILRLLIDQQLLKELEANLGRADKVESLSFHRVIDNGALRLTGEELWIQLNYQVMHLLDFLPASCWESQSSDPLFQTFVELITLLQKAGKLEAQVNYEAASGELTYEGQPVTLGSLIQRAVNGLLGAGAMRKIQKKAINKFSAAIGHSLKYELKFSA